MANKTVFLKYQINLPDPLQVAELQHGPVVPGGAVGIAAMCPDKAAIKYSAPILLGNAVFVSPSCTSGWFSTNGNHYPTDQDTFERKEGGFLGIPFLFPDHVTYVWRGEFNWAPNPGDPSSPGVPAAISQRRWIDGFELGGGENAGQQGESSRTRKASRHCEGFGYELRSTSNSAISHNVNEFAGAFTPNKSWERFYVNVRRAPTASSLIWRNHSSVSASDGIRLDVLPSGQLALNASDNVGNLTLIATTAAVTIGKWNRVDILCQFGTGYQARLFLNGVEVITATAFGGTGMGGSGRTHISSDMGGTGTGNNMVVDVDDWMCADWPATLDGADWVRGSRILALTPTGAAAGNQWAGDWRVMASNPNLPNAAQSLTSTTNAQRLVVTTDGARQINDRPETIGAVAMIVSVYSSSAGLNGQIGYRLNGVETLAAAAPSETSVLNMRHVCYRPAGLTEPVSLVPIELVYVKAADVTLATVKQLMAVVETLGIFDQADVLPTTGGGTALDTPPAFRGIHNAPYPTTPWARAGVPPQSPVLVVGGTYVGNGAGQDLTFRAPIHWLWLRNTASGVSTLWWSSLATSHEGISTSPMPGTLVRFELDPDYAPGAGEDILQAQYKVRIAGAHADVNQNAVTYQYVAFGDPGNRFAIMDALPDIVTITGVDRVTALPDPTFTPQAAFLWQEQFGNASTSAAFYKGPGSGASVVHLLDGGADVSTAITFQAGSLTLLGGSSFLLNSGSKAVAFAAFRGNDGSGDVGVPRAVQLFSYVGDGNATRTVAFASPSGRRPLFALVMPHNSNGAIFRDPSHLTTASTALPNSANASTGIIGGGIDNIQVGSTLNANAVTYDVFVLPGDTVAGNGGFSVNGEFIPVDPSYAPGAAAGWTDPAEGFDVTGTTIPPVVVVTPGGDEFATACLSWSQKVINVALGYLGISQQVGNAATDVSPEAVVARLHYDEAVQTTLRRYPWPFATKYALLTPATGTPDAPVNLDWTYSYPAPVDLIFARRLVRQEVERAWDRTPYRFRQVAMTVYTNEETPMLEYTARPTCAASAGDALFRDALAWQLAARMAPALSRDEKKAEACLAMFEHMLPKAEVAAGNEAQPDPQPGEADWIAGRD